MDAQKLNHLSHLLDAKEAQTKACEKCIHSEVCEHRQHVLELENNIVVPQRLLDIVKITFQCKFAVARTNLLR